MWRFLHLSAPRFFIISTLFLSALLISGQFAFAAKGTVAGGGLDPVPIAIAPFIAGPGTEEVAKMMTEVVANDLGNTGYFHVLPPDSYIEHIDDFNKTPRFEDWKGIRAQFLVVGQTYNDGKNIKLEYKLYNVDNGTTLDGQQFATTAKNVRRIAHRAADAIYKKLTSFEGYFDTQIVFVDESGPKEKRVKKLAVMDQDGYNFRTLTDGGDIVITPRFSPNSQEITYMSIGKGTPRVFLFNIDTRQKEIVGEFANMSFAPRFSPDGEHVIMSLLDEDGRNSNIHVLDLRSRQVQRLTNTPAINTAPSYSPDGSRITFESDRGGSQQIYVMNADGSNQTRISFGNGGRYSTPVWSPDGEYIAFTKQAGGQFSIGVMKPDGSGERILTEGYHNEGPTWAPNGRVLMFFREQQSQQGGPKLFSVDITGYNERQITTPAFASDPAWSPRLK